MNLVSVIACGLFAVSALAATGAKTIKASKIPANAKPQSIVVIDGKKVQLSGKTSADGACVCDPACTDGKYCDGCNGCRE
jgi:hypothetical protein